MSNVQLQVITIPEQLDRLQPEWNELLDSSAVSTPFHSPEWLLTWWGCFRSGELRVLAFRERGKLAAIIPCFLHTWEGRRQLTLLGSGVSDYLEPVIAADRVPDVLDLLQGYLRDAPDWEICKWQDLSSPTPLARLDGAGLCVRMEEDTPCSATPMGGSWDEFWPGRPHGLRRNLRRYAEKARQVADWHFFAERTFKPELLEMLIRLHGARWQSHGESGMIAANRSADFLREAVPRLGATGQLIFFGLTFQDRTVALILSFPYRNVLFSYLSGFDPEYAEYGFGRLLLCNSLEYAFEKKFTSWNFLRGNEPYKSDWGSRVIPKCRLIISRNGG